MAIKEDSLDLAIDLEKEGHEYYTQHAKKAENPLSKKVLETLAAMELDHIEVVKKIAEGKSVTADELKKIDVEQKVKGVFDEFSESERKGWKEQDSSAYEHALKLETKLAELYKQLAKETSDSEEKDFFHALMREEDKHYELIYNAMYYLTDPKSWASEFEGEVWNWMNI